MPLSDSIAALEGKFSILSKREFRGETALTVQREDILEICRFCKESLGFDYLIDVSSVDNFGEEPRFEMVYELSSIATNEHLRLKLSVSEDEPNVATVSGVWPTANWHEREIFDMMGIGFTGHPDLRRILMWDGYPYFPLRKDFPLAGKPSEVPEVAFTKAAPLEGGPFVTHPTSATVKDREPRARRMEE
jgi:NADH-quinone oxidoreductase subunit C